jgi:hypothetical protein
VKKLELEVNKLKKQAKVQSPQDNRNNVVKKLEKEKTALNIASQPSKKQAQNEKDEKEEYARSVFLNARRTHIKSGIGYNASYPYTNDSHVSHMSYHNFDASYVLMRNKFRKIITLHVGPHHKRSKTCVWVPKCLVTNLRGPNQTWVPKIKA